MAKEENKKVKPQESDAKKEISEQELKKVAGGQCRLNGVRCGR